MHVYVLEHIVSLYYRTAVWMFTKLGRHEMLMVPVQMMLFFGQICPGADPGRGQNRSMGVPLLQGTSASDWKATATNQMHSNDLEACGDVVFLLLVPFQSQIFYSFSTSFLTCSLALF